MSFLSLFHGDREAEPQYRHIRLRVELLITTFNPVFDSQLTLFKKKKKKKKEKDKSAW